MTSSLGDPTLFATSDLKDYPYHITATSFRREGFPMYRSFQARNFRLFENLELTDLGRINLVTGRNASGKTTLLEALFIHCGGFRPDLTLAVNAFRGLKTVNLPPDPLSESPWDSVFRDYDRRSVMELSGEETDDDLASPRRLTLRTVTDPSELEEARVVERLDLRSEGPSTAGPRAWVLELMIDAPSTTNPPAKYYLIVDAQGIRTVPVPPDPPLPAYFLAATAHELWREDAKLFTNLVLRNDDATVLDILRILHPQLTKLSMAASGPDTLIYGSTNASHLQPLALLGEGLKRLASIAIRIANAPRGIVLIDEIENGLHHSTLVDVWRSLGQAAIRYNTQIFATTHSYECIRAAAKAFLATPVDFRLHRLEQANGRVEVFSYDSATLTAAIDAGLETR